MASTASKSKARDFLNAVTNGIANQVLHPRTYSCEIPNYEDDRPLTLAIDETARGSGLWTARITKDVCSELIGKVTDAGFVPGYEPFAHEPLIPEPLGTEEILRTMDRLVSEAAPQISPYYHAQYLQSIRQPLLDIMQKKALALAPSI